MTTASPVRRVRSLGAGVVAVIMGAAVLLVGPSAEPAHACSCFATTDEELFAGAEAVFRGQLTAYQPPPAQPMMSSMDPAIWTFAVSEVYKGEVASSQDIVSNISSASCGLGLPHQGEFFVFASRRDLHGGGADRYHAYACGGTRSTAAGPLEVAALQPATTTTPPTPTTAAPRVTTAPPQATATTVTPFVVAEPAPSTTVAADSANLERQSVARPDAAMVAAADEGPGLPLAPVVIAATGALLGLSGVGVHRRRQRRAPRA